MRVAFRKTKIRDNKYIIQLNCDEEEKVFDDIDKLKEYVDKTLRYHYKNNYSEGLSDIFLKLVDLNFELEKSDNKDDFEIMCSYAEYARVLNNYHIKRGIY